MRIPFYRAHRSHAGLEEDLKRSFDLVLRSGTLIKGLEEKQFLAEYAAFIGTSHAVGVNSGLDALTFALKALDIGAGDEVIVPAHTYVATWLAVVHAGATPVPVECDGSTCNIDAEAIEAAITERTRAIIPVHLYGRPCEMTAIMGLAGKRDLHVVEDNAQAHGAYHAGKRTGSFGHINATSFYPTKNLGALGDGGAVTTDREDLAQEVRRRGNYGSLVKDVHAILGANSRLDELQAAFLRVKLRHLDAWNAERRAQADFYTTALADLPGLATPPDDPAGTRSVHHLYVIRVEERDRLRTKLEAKGIGTMVHYPTPPHLQAAFAPFGWEQGAFPVAERLARTVLSLPLHPGLEPAEQEYIVDSIREVVQ